MEAATTRVTSHAFRDVIGRFATGVTVVTSRDDEGDHGMTASAVSSLSLDPPMLLVCINRRSRTGDALRRSGRFTVNVLADDQAAAAERFATPSDDRFAGVPTTRGPFGTLVLEGSLAHIDCHVEDAVAAATHHIIIGRVEWVAARDAAPLAYFRGQFGQLHPARDDAVTQHLRQRILSEDCGVLDRATLATELDVDVGRIDRALAALRAEGLVTGDPLEGYHAAPVDIGAIDDALSARLAIELGAVELVADHGDGQRVAELRRLADNTVALFEDARVTDIAAYAAANTAFHEELVRLSGSVALLDSYRRLSLQGILVRGVVEDHALTRAHADDHVEIADAVAAGDPAQARAAIQRHTDRARATHRAASGPGTSS
ncbi:MAG TPA: flavin reductase [Euzebyales bacterium]|nr:flavin reductase [Euzebyales bacterium]